jgi:hypothetical protein
MVVQEGSWGYQQCTTSHTTIHNTPTIFHALVNFALLNSAKVKREIKELSPRP